MYNFYYHFPFLTDFFDGKFGLPLVLSPQMEQSISSIRRLVETGSMPPDCSYDQARNLFFSRKTSIFITGPWDIESFKDQNIGIAPIFSFTDRKTRPFLGIKCFYVSKNSSNKELAREFLYTLLSEKFQQRLLKLRVPPANKKVVIGDDPFLKFYFENLPYTYPLPGGPEMATVWSAGKALLYLTLHDRQDFSLAMEKISHEIDKNSP